MAKTLAESLGVHQGDIFTIQGYEDLFTITKSDSFCYADNPDSWSWAILLALSRAIYNPNLITCQKYNLKSNLSNEEFCYLKYLYTNCGVEKIQKINEKKYYLNNTSVECNLFPSMPFGYYNLREVFQN